MNLPKYPNLSSIGSLPSLKDTTSIKSQMGPLKSINTCVMCSRATSDYFCPLVGKEICSTCCETLKSESTCINKKCEWY